MLEINSVEPSNESAGLAEIENSTLASRTKYSDDLSQASVIISKVSESEGRRYKIEL